MSIRMQLETTPNGAWPDHIYLRSESGSVHTRLVRLYLSEEKRAELSCQTALEASFSWHMLR